MDYTQSSFPTSSGPSSSKAPRCGIDGCRSRRFHVDNGLTYCHRGHQQEGLIEQAQEFEDINLKASQTTRIHDSQKQAETQRLIEAQRGPQGLEQLLIIFQHVLQLNTWRIMEKEIARGVGTGDDGDELFEKLVYDLWGMRLQVLHNEGAELKGDGGKRISRGRSKYFGRKKKRKVKTVGRGRHKEVIVQEGSSDDEDEIRRLREVKNEEADELITSKGQPHHILPTLVESIALLYIAAVCLKIPLPLSKLQWWAQREELLFSEAHDNIPADMLRSLAPGYQVIFRTEGLLKDGVLHRCVADLVVRLQKNFTTLKLPTLNYQLILLDYLTRLGLPLHLYTEVENLAKTLSIEFTTTGLTDVTTGLMVQELPEMQLIALIVVAAKLFFPFNHERIYAKSASDPAILAMNWEQWDRIFMEREAEYKEEDRIRDTLYPEHQKTVDVQEAHDMNFEQVDAYLDYIEKNMQEIEHVQIEDNTETKHTKNAMRRGTKRFYDPQEDGNEGAAGSGHTADDREARDGRDAARTERLLQRIHASLQIREIISEKAEGKQVESVPRAGWNYPLYRHLEQLEAEKWAKVFYQRVADVAGMPLKMLLGTVVAMEERIEYIRQLREGPPVVPDDENMDVDT